MKGNKFNNVNKVSKANCVLINLLTFCIALLTCSNTFGSSILVAKKITDTITIDGIADESSWQQGKWHPINQLILGNKPTKEDFSGQFKILWDEGKLYLLVEVIDDVLFDQYANPLYRYWDDDCLEIFIDEDASGGNHQFNFNAFAYHIALDNQVVDIGLNHKDGSTNFVLLNEHITSVWKRNVSYTNKLTWEVAVSVYDDSFALTPNETSSKQPVKLHKEKTLGFMLAYCDNDGSKEREHFIGSTDIKAVNGDKNLGYITADVFQTLVLKQ